MKDERKRWGVRVLLDDSFGVFVFGMISSENRTAAATPQHIPVMLDDVLHALRPQDGGIYVDGTFGAGGYTRAILESADCTVYGIDRDPEAFARAKALQRDFPDRFIPLHGCFGDVADLLADQNIDAVDGFVLDIGVSSIQLSTAARGFSFQHDGPLDMRMSLDGMSAADVVNTADEAELADIIYTYGEERASRRIAKEIVAARAKGDITTTKELADIIHRVLPMHGGMKTDTATKTFQALRIHVNDELGELERAMDAAEDILKTAGRLVVVTFHSLEDWRVKNFFRDKSGHVVGTSRHLPQNPAAAPPVIFELEKKNGVAPSAAEIARNPRARSARLRMGIRSAHGKGGDA